MPYNEIVNKSWCDKIANMSFADFYKLYVENKNDGELTTGADVRSCYTTTINTCKHFIKNKYKITTSYTQQDGIARQYAKGFSIQKLSGMIRNTLCEGIYKDFDMQNAHPRLLENLCKKHLIDCPYLTFFNSNREKCYENLFEELDCFDGDVRSYVKTLFIKSINSEWLVQKHDLKGKKKIKDSNFIRFDEEIKAIQTKLMAIYGDFLKKINFKKNNGNKKGKFIAFLLQNEENDVLNKVTSHYSIPDASVLMYDGFLINDALLDDDSDIINKLNEITKDQNITWSEKPIKSSILEELNKMEFNENLFQAHISNIPHDHADFLLHNQLKNRLYKCDGIYYFKAEKCWINDEKIIQKQLIKEIVKFELYFTKENQATGEWEIKPIRENLQLMKDIVYMLTCLNDNDNNLLDRIYEHTMRKLYFNNGIYNFDTETIEENDYDSFIIIDRDLNMDRNDSVRKEIYDRVLNPIFGVVIGADDYKERSQLRDHYLLTTARTMAGCVEDKEWVVSLGNRNCGKGVLNDFFANTFGKYVKSTNTENFLYKKTNDESAKANSFMLQLQFQRMVVGNECAIDKSGTTTLCGNKIKKYHSGGDYIEGRALYQNETTFRLQSRCFFSMNDFPRVEPNDATTLLITYEFKSKFIKKGEKKKYNNITYLEADDTIKTEFIKRDDVLNEFALLIFDSYKSNAIYPKELKAEIVEDREDDEDKLFNLYDITHDPDDKINNEAIKAMCKEHQINFTIRKVLAILTGKGAKKFRTGTTRGLQGIIVREDDE